MEAEKFQDLQFKAWEPGERMVSVPVWVQRQERTDVPALKSSGRVNSLLLSLFSIQAFYILDEAHPHWGGQFIFTQFIDLDANITQKNSHRPIQKNA